MVYSICWLEKRLFISWYLLNYWNWPFDPFLKTRLFVAILLCRRVCLRFSSWTRATVPCYKLQRALSLGLRWEDALNKLNQARCKVPRTSKDFNLRLPNLDSQIVKRCEKPTTLFAALVACTDTLPSEGGACRIVKSDEIIHLSIARTPKTTIHVQKRVTCKTKGLDTVVVSFDRRWQEEMEGSHSFATFEGKQASFLHMIYVVSVVSRSFMHLIAAHWSNADHTLSRWHHDFTLALCSQGFLQHRTLKYTETKFHVASSLWLHNMISWFPWFHRFAQNVTLHLHHLGLCMRLPFPTLDSWSSTWNIMHPWAWFSWKRLGKEKPPFFFGTLPFQIPSWTLWGCIL